ncbi:hypothetical protein [Romboutsia sp.]|uniref:hypothetical protein n=1 Tax=Romboutsia sp. TaxID=1965302 RepID=UPI003F2FD7CD
MLQKMTGTGGFQINIPHLPTTLSDHPSLVGIIRLPFCNTFSQKSDITLPIYVENKWKMVTQIVELATEITQITFEDTPFTVPKTNITDFYPYTYYVLTDGECEPLVMHPQYMPSQCTIKGRYALSHQPIERYFIEGYKGDNNGSVYNITNLNQMMLPTATNEGTNYMNANANTIMQNRKSTVTSNIMSAISGVGQTIGAGATMGPGAGIGVGLNSVANSINGLNEIKNIDARNQDTLLTPNSISSFGTPSSRIAFDCDSVKVIKYSIKDNVKNKINNFVNRYGNKYNNYDTIDIKNYKGYIKFISPDIDGKIDNIYTDKIISILERGVFIE